MRRKALLLILCFCLFLPTLTACKEKDRDYVESEVVAAAESLIKKSIILNEIYWGAGIRYEKPEGDAEAKGYFPADKEHLAELEELYGIKDLTTLQNKTREVFSQAGYNWILSSCLTNVTGSNGIVSYARYYQAKKNEDLGKEEGLMVYAGATNIYEKTANVEYVFDGMHVLDVNGQVITVALKVKTTGLNGTVMTRDFTVDLIEEANGWRLNGASYATHVMP